MRLRRRPATLRPIDLPAVLGEAFDVAGEVRMRVPRTARAARGMMYGMAAYRNAQYAADGDAIASLRERIEAVDELFWDPDRTRFWAVLTTERMALVETERLVARPGRAGTHSTSRFGSSLIGAARPRGLMRSLGSVLVCCRRAPSELLPSDHSPRVASQPPASITAKSLPQFSSSSPSGSWLRSCWRSEGGTSDSTRSMTTCA